MSARLLAHWKGSDVQMSRLAREPVRVTISGTLENGSPLAAGNITAVTFAVLPVRTRPGPSTTWVPPAAYSALVADLTLAGPDASPTGAVPVTSSSGDLWMLVTGTGTSTKPVFIERINVT